MNTSGLIADLFLDEIDQIAEQISGWYITQVSFLYNTEKRTQNTPYFVNKLNNILTYNKNVYLVKALVGTGVAN